MVETTSPSPMATIINSASGRILCVSDIRGDFKKLNDMVKEVNAVAVIHTGDFGFIDGGSPARMAPRILRHVLSYTPLLDTSNRPNFLSLPYGPDLFKLLDPHPSDPTSFILSQLGELLTGQIKFSVPVYTVYGPVEDVRVLEKFRTGEYEVENLMILDEALTRSLEVGGVKFRLFGLGGGVMMHKMFDNGEGAATIAGGAGTVWATALQIGELVDTAERVFDPSETRILVTHGSIGREGLLAQLAMVLKADLTVSGSLHFRFVGSFNEFGVQSEPEAFKAKLLKSKNQFMEVYDSAKVQLENSIAADQREFLQKALQVAQKAPISEGKEEDQFWKNCWNWSLSEASFGHLILNIKEGRVSAETVSQGLNFAYRRAPKIRPTPAATTSQPNVNVNTNTVSSAQSASRPVAAPTAAPAAAVNKPTPQPQSQPQPRAESKPAPPSQQPATSNASGGPASGTKPQANPPIAPRGAVAPSAPANKPAPASSVAKPAAAAPEQPVKNAFNQSKPNGVPVETAQGGQTSQPQSAQAQPQPQSQGQAQPSSQVQQGNKRERERKPSGRVDGQGQNKIDGKDKENTTPKVNGVESADRGEKKPRGKGSSNFKEKEAGSSNATTPVPAASPALTKGNNTDGQVGVKAEKEPVKNEQEKQAGVGEKKVNGEEGAVAAGAAPAPRKEFTKIPAVYIKGLPTAVVEEDLRNYFNADIRSKITRVKIPAGFEGKPKGFAYVEFGNDEDVQIALTKHAETLNGVNIQIAVSNPPTSSSRGRGGANGGSGFRGSSRGDFRGGRGGGYRGGFNNNNNNTNNNKPVAA